MFKNSLLNTMMLWLQLSMVQNASVYQKSTLLLVLLDVINILTRKPSCRWQTCAMLAKSLHGLRRSSGVV